MARSSLAHGDATHQHWQGVGARTGRARSGTDLFDLGGRPFVALVIVGYVILWIVEGAFRKWVPGTGLVFYVLRDVYAVSALVLLAARVPSRRRAAWWVIAGVLLLSVWLLMQYAHSSGTSSTVLLFGLRSYLAPCLLAMLAWKYVTHGAGLTYTAVVAVAAPIELALSSLQVVSPPDSFINVTVGGTANEFVNAGGVVRATGTFSSPLGLSAYLLIALMVGLWWTTILGRRAAGWAVVAVVLATTALSGARGSVLIGAILVLVYVLHAFINPSLSAAGRVLGIIILLLVALLTIQAVFPGVLEAFTTRFENAAAGEDSSDRLFDSFTIYLSRTPPLIGEGMGTRSNAGIALGSSAQWIENDGLRWVAELGLLGFVLSLARTLAVVLLVLVSVRRMRRDTLEVVIVRAALVLLLVLGSVNSTPTGEGAFSILLTTYILVIALSKTEPDQDARR